MPFPQLRVSMMDFINVLPLEILFEIFSRLPTDSVLECKLVSKPWRNLIQRPSFEQLHLKHLNDVDSAHDSGKSSFICYLIGVEKQFSYTEYDENLNRFSRTTRINLRPPFENYYILGSCNGLICLNACCDNTYYEPAYICNPITREYILLPKSQEKEFITGFGYSPSTNEYKVVRICTSRRDPDFGLVEIYTLGSGIGWRNIGQMDYDVRSIRYHGVFVNGAIYWVDWCQGTIVAFDLAEEEFHKLPSLPGFPRAGNPFLSGFRLHVLGDFLCAYYIDANGLDMRFLKSITNYQDTIWSTKEFGGILHIYKKPITLTKSGRLLCYDSVDKNVYLYAPEASCSRILLVDSGEKYNYCVPHKNTLVSLKALGEEDTKQMETGETDRA